MGYKINDIDGARITTQELGKVVEEAAVIAANISSMVSDLEGQTSTAGLAAQAAPKLAKLSEEMDRLNVNYDEGNKVLQMFINANEEVDAFDVGSELSNRLS